MSSATFQMEWDESSARASVISEEVGLSSTSDLGFAINVRMRPIGKKLESLALFLSPLCLPAPQMAFRLRLLISCLLCFPAAAAGVRIPLRAYLYRSRIKEPENTIPLVLVKRPGRFFRVVAAMPRRACFIAHA